MTDIVEHPLGLPGLALSIRQSWAHAVAVGCKVDAARRAAGRPAADGDTAMTDIKTFSIAVEGFAPAHYCARSAAKARARCWRDYTAAHDCTFRQFLEISTITRIKNPPGVGDRVLIAGLPATRVLTEGGQYTAYMRDDSDDIFYSHPLDVAEI